ncbi:transmembrane component CbrV of energizing module of predicted cobalamin ECF transporter [Cutibacterium acnes JCM 18916]|nr:transmembrane component CbrV of energizing module of predicted cobalamin ECF transporter [Cutibacterium acnes JCM 18916]
MPAALHDISVAVVIALSVFPQLIASAQRVRRARRLRGNTRKGIRALGGRARPGIGRLGGDVDVPGPRDGVPRIRAHP